MNSFYNRLQQSNHLSQHPLAKAIVNYAHENGVEELEATDFQSVTGKGAFAIVGGRSTIYIGSIDWVQEILPLPARSFARNISDTSTRRKIGHGDCHWIRNTAA